jgi:riboflavin synthase
MMFTGIIEKTGVIKQIKEYAKGLNLTIIYDVGDMTTGESIALNGVCVTLTSHTPHSFDCDISPETLAVTTFSDFQVGQKVSLERPLSLQNPLGGHFVLGHVDDVLLLEDKSTLENFTKLRFKGVKHNEWLVEKGSVTIDGVSLTVNRVELDALTCMIIPHTLKMTHLAELEPGSRVNVEYDYLAKLVAKQYSLSLKSSVS